MQGDIFSSIKHLLRAYFIIGTMAKIILGKVGENLKVALGH